MRRVRFGTDRVVHLKIVAHPRKLRQHRQKRGDTDTASDQQVFTARSLTANRLLGWPTHIVSPGAIWVCTNSDPPRGVLDP